MRTIVVAVPADIVFEIKVADDATDENIKQQAADSLNAALDEYHGFQLDTVLIRARAYPQPQEAIDLEETVVEGIEVVKAHDIEIRDDCKDAPQIASAKPMLHIENPI